MAFCLEAAGRMPEAAVPGAHQDLPNLSVGICSTDAMKSGVRSASAALQTIDCLEKMMFWNPNLAGLTYVMN